MLLATRLVGLISTVAPRGCLLGPPMTPAEYGGMLWRARPFLPWAAGLFGNMKRVRVGGCL